MPMHTQHRKVFRTQASPATAHWDGDLGEYILDWDDVRNDPDPAASGLASARWAFRHACTVCNWDLALLASAEGSHRRFRESC